MTPMIDTSSLKSTFLKTLIERGYLHQCTNLEGLDEVLCQGVLTAYIGFDATAPSLHVGNLLGIMLARHLQKAGHRPLILVGGGTTRIGDPSGKDTARQLLSDAAIQKNMEGISQVFSKFISFEKEKTGALLVNNADWLDKINYIDFLREYGRHFSVNRMLTFESVRLRLEREQPLTFLEFNYMILQGYDFLELHHRFGCQLQLGGSDQWGNIINGIDLIRKTQHQECFGLTIPLLTTANGQKMGKSAQGAVWLNEEMVTPYEYWQFWRNTQDEDVVRFLKLYTEIPLKEIEELGNLKGAEINQAKIRLADEATRLLHGEEALAHVHSTTAQVFGGQGTLNQEGDLPKLGLPESDLGHLSLVQALYLLGLTKTKGEARRLIQGKGARLNDRVIEDETQVLMPEDLIEGIAKVSAGKKRHGILYLIQ